MKLVARDGKLCRFLFDLLKLGASLCRCMSFYFEKEFSFGRRKEGGVGKVNFSDERCVEEGEVFENSPPTQSRSVSGNGENGPGGESSDCVSLEEALIQVGFITDERLAAEGLWAKRETLGGWPATLDAQCLLSAAGG